MIMEGQSILDRIPPLMSIMRTPESATNKTFLQNLICRSEKHLTRVIAPDSYLQSNPFSVL
jgi:hypothetical protein